MINDAENVGIAVIIITEVDSTAHEKRGIFISGKSGCFIFKIVTTKLTEPSTDDIDNSLSAQIHISAAGPGAFNIE
jgi:hypothetical protein